MVLHYLISFLIRFEVLWKESADHIPILLVATPCDKITTSYIERQNLTIRQDNNRVSRKTIGFSKKLRELNGQMTLYFAHFNFCRGHGSLKHPDENGVMRKYSPAMECELIDHNWTLRELLNSPYHITST